MQALKYKTTYLLLVNALGMILYSIVKIPIVPRDGGPPGPGDGIYFMLYVFPLLTVFFAVNGLACFKIYKTKLNERRRWAMASLTGISASWLLIVHFLS